jgi:ABC-type Fe3+ transport system substrate-binding protein
MYQILPVALTRSARHRAHALRFLGYMQTREAGEMLVKSGFGLLANPAPEQFFERDSELLKKPGTRELILRTRFIGKSSRNGNNRYYPVYEEGEQR